MMEQAKYDVFISYSRDDYMDKHKIVIPGNEVSKIIKALTEAGITFWFDEKGIYHGDEFAGVIADAIDESSLFVFISSEHSNNSNWTLGEIATAQEAKKKIIPVRIDSARYHKSLRVRLNALDYIDYKTNPEKGRQELVQSINAYLEEVKTNEKRIQEELERLRQRQEEEKKRQEQIEKKETEISALESQRTEIEKVVLQKEKELESARIDLRACESKIQKLQKKLLELREIQVSEQIRKIEENSFAKEEESEEEVFTKERTFTVGGVSFKMIHVDGGRFQMGSPDNDQDAYDDEKPQHWVVLNDFYIGETVVTQSLWKEVMKKNPSWFKGDEDKLPVEQVSWNDCMEFVMKLNRHKDVRKELKGMEFRLPTEAEWEYAARGGEKSLGFKYAGGNNIDDVAWYDVDSDNKTHPAKSKRGNELGIFGMSGNVLEWCQDWKGSYSSSEQINPQGPSSGLRRVIRGGSWFIGAGGCRVASRRSGTPSYRISRIGFRLVLDGQ